MKVEEMKKVVALMLAVIVAGCAAGSKETRKKAKSPQEICSDKDVMIVLGDLGELYNQFLGGRLDVFKEQPICWDRVDMSKYDKFFDDAFLTIAYFRLAQRVVKIANESIAQGAVGDPNADFVIAGSALLPIIREAKPRVKELIQTCKALFKSVKSDFKGWKAMKKIPIVKDNLQMILDNLNEISSEMDSILEGLIKISKISRNK